MRKQIVLKEVKQNWHYTFHSIAIGTQEKQRKTSQQHAHTSQKTKKKPSEREKRNGREKKLTRLLYAVCLSSWTFFIGGTICIDYITIRLKKIYYLNFFSLH
jgi:hypothetical protein